MCPVSVQGEVAAGQIIKAINDVNNFTDCDLIIVGRGGGSVEDLWCFNDEQLARNIYASNIPVISAVGHETDFTICDFAADLRAPTPSAAAELAAPDINDYIFTINEFKNRSYNVVMSIYNRYNEVFKLLTQRKSISDKNYFTEMLSIRLDNLYSKLNGQFSKTYSETINKLISLTAKLDALNPAKILLRGYAFAEKNGETIKSVDSLNINDTVDIVFSDGNAECLVKKVERKN
jgi:exodeoxyribonuclease VII large subunit